MENNSRSPSRAAKDVEAQVNRILRAAGVHKFSGKEREIISKLMQELADARIYTRDYELSETREEQLDNAKKAKKWLERSEKNILEASKYDIFNAIDVAHLSAQIDQTIVGLK